MMGFSEGYKLFRSFMLKHTWEFCSQNWEGGGGGGNHKLHIRTAWSQKKLEHYET